MMKWVSAAYYATTILFWLQIQHKLLKQVFPPKDPAVIRKRKYLLRMAVIISATYAYYRQLLPPEAFKRKLLYRKFFAFITH